MEDKEKIENKSNCCGDTKNCPHCMMGMNNMGGGCFHHCMKKRCIIRKIIFIILIIIAFNVGVQWGEMKALVKGNHYSERGQMMNWGYNQIRQDEQEAKPDVSDASEPPVAPIAPVKAQ